jgi:arylsulfatase
MKLARQILFNGILTCILVAAATLLQAQQVTGELGSPSATTTIDGKQLPPPDPTFGGVIKEKATDSKPWWPPRIVPPKDAPNILYFWRRHPDPGLGSHR